MSQKEGTSYDDLSEQSSRRRGRGAFRRAPLLFVGVDASAQNAGYGVDAFSEFSELDAPRDERSAAAGYEIAPGYERPDFETEPQERKEITVFEDAPQSNEPEALDRPINEFAGERQRYNNGLFDVIFGR